MTKVKKQKLTQALNALTIATKKCADGFNQFDFVIKNTRIDLPEPPILKNEKPYYRMNQKY